MTADELDAIYRSIAVIFGLGQAVTGLETLVTRDDYGRSGILPWRIVRLRSRLWSRDSGFSAHVARLADVNGTAVVSAVRILASGGVVVLMPRSPLFTVSTALLMSTVAWMGYRQLLGGEGADQMALILSGALLIGANAFATPSVSRIAVLFVAAQGCLAYLTSGIAKLPSQKWRSGSGLYGVMSTYGFGWPRLSSILGRRPKVSALATWGLLSFEILFPVCLFTPPHITAAFLVAGATFHVSTALIMGLNSFVWTFVATYPAIWHVAQSI